MADTLSANVAESTTEIITATIELIPHKAVCPNLVVRKTIPKGFDRVEIPRVNSTSSVTQPTEGDELVVTSQFDLTSTTIQPTRRTIMVRVTDRTTQFSKDDIIAMISEEMAQTEAVDMDQDIMAEFANLTAFSASTTGIGGGTTVNLVLGDLRRARSILKNNSRANGGAAPGRLYGVIGAPQEEDLMVDLGALGLSVLTTANMTANPANMSGIPETIIREYGLPSIVMGLNLFVDPNLPEDTNGDVTIGIFSEKALYLAVSKEWDLKTFEVPNWDGVILRAIADYNTGVGGYPNWGGSILVDGS